MIDEFAPLILITSKMADAMIEGNQGRRRQLLKKLLQLESSVSLLKLLNLKKLLIVVEGNNG